MEYAIKKRDSKAAKLLLDYGADAGNLLYEAVKMGNPQIVSMLLDKGADPNSPETNPVTGLFFSGSQETLSLLISHGVDFKRVWEGYQIAAHFVKAKSPLLPFISQAIDFVPEGLSRSERKYFEDSRKMKVSLPDAAKISCKILNPFI